jgi:hypothetical protein
MSKIKETKVYNINDFISWDEKGELDLSPKYQRNPVWNAKAKAYLIDTIVRGLPIPQIFIRQIIDTSTRKTYREVIDGQQRMRAIIEFYNGDFSILKSHNKELGGKFYDELEEEDKQAFLFYDIPVEVIKASKEEDSIIYNMFARLNTNSMTLNKQELRNAQYWGDFKVFIYRLSSYWRDFFAEYGVFKDKDFARMNDSEFISSLVILLLNGITTETPSKIDEFYKNYDENFSDEDEIEIKFERIMRLCSEIFEMDLGSGFFHRKNYFYTLFAAIFHQVFGINNFDGKRNNKFSDENINSNLKELKKKLIEFESKYEKFIEDNDANLSDVSFLTTFERNHVKRTTNEKERKERVNILLDYLV